MTRSHMIATLVLALPVTGWAQVVGTRDPLGGLGAAPAPVELRGVSVRGGVTFTELAFPAPPSATVVDSFDVARSALYLTMQGVSAPGDGMRAVVGRGGIVTVNTIPQGPATVRLGVYLTFRRSYEVQRDSTAVRVVFDGTGEEFPATTITLVPQRLRLDTDEGMALHGLALARFTTDSTGAATGGAKPRGGRELLDEASLTPDDYTRKRFREWSDAASFALLSLSWDRVPLRDALAALSKASKRSIVAGTGTDTLHVSGDFREARWTDVLQTVARVYGLRARVSGGDIVLLESLAAVQAIEEAGPLDTKVFQISYTRTDKVVEALKPLLTKRGAVTALNEKGQLLVRDTPDALDRIAGIVRLTDVPTRQVRISAMVVSMDRGVARDLGFTYDVAERGGNSVGGIPIPAGSGGDSAGAGPQPNSGDPNAFNLIRNGNSVGGAITPPPVTSPALRVLLSGLVGNFSVAGLVQALESHRFARVVARQSGLVKDGDEFQGNSGERTPLRSVGVIGQGGVQNPGTGGVGNGQANGPGQGNGAGGFPFASVGLVETGIKLHVTPRVEPDSMISLDVNVERSSAIPSGIGDAGVQFVQNVYTTKFRARAGQTVVIGGLQDKVESEQEAGVPLLSSIPLLGNLFKSTSKSKAERTLIVLVTATIEP